MRALAAIMLVLLAPLLLAAGPVSKAVQPPFAAVRPGVPLRFPADHGAHPDFRTEWWYVTGWLDTPQGPRGFQITFFRSRPELAGDNPSAFTPRQIIFAHAALADRAHGRLRHATRIARAGFGLAGARVGDMDVKVDDWRLWRTADGRLQARVAGDGFALDLAFTPTQQRGLVLLFTDGEELGLVGARAIFADGTKGDPIAGRLGVVINLEARGGGGRTMMFQTGPENGDLVRLLARSSPDAAASSVAVTVYESLPNDTDFTPVLKRGVAGLNFAFIGEAWGYHSPLMTPDRLEQGALQHLGDSALGVTRSLLTAKALPGPAPSAVFATMPGLGLLVYRPAAGWGVLALSAGLLALAAWWRRDDWTIAASALSFGQAVLVLVIAGLLMFGLNLVSGSVGAEYYDRLAALPRLELVAGLAALAALLFAASAPAGSAWDRWLTWAKLCFVAALAVQIWLPGAGPVFAWPALMAALAAAIGARSSGIMQHVPAALLAVPGLALTAELAHFAFLGVGAPMPWATAPLLVPVLALLAPLVPAGPRRPALAGLSASVAAALAVALWVNLDAPAASVPPYAGTEKSQG